MASDPLPPPRPGAVLRPLQAADLPPAAKLHVRALPDGVFSRLGPRFVQRYLETYLVGPAAVALAAEVDGRFVGHLVGTVGPGHHTWALRHAWRRLLPAALLALLLRPGLALHLVRTRLARYVRAVRRAARGSAATTQQSGAGAAPGLAALLHVAVEPEARGSGAGSLLVRGFEERARRAGCPTARLVTFAGDPADPSTGAGAFYERLGWHRAGKRVNDTGQQVLVYARSL